MFIHIYNVNKHNFFSIIFTLTPPLASSNSPLLEKIAGSQSLCTIARVMYSTYTALLKERCSPPVILDIILVV